MVYTKTLNGNNKEIKVDFYGDEFFSTCPVCGLEIEIEPKEIAEILLGDGDFSFQRYCDDCAKVASKAWREHRVTGESVIDIARRMLKLDGDGYYEEVCCAELAVLENCTISDVVETDGDVFVSFKDGATDDIELWIQSSGVLLLHDPRNTEA